MEMSRVFVEELGFTRSAVDHSVFYRRDGETHVVVAVATDDMAVTSKRAVDAIKWFLGFEIKRDRNARTRCETSVDTNGPRKPVLNRPVPVLLKPNG